MDSPKIDPALVARLHTMATVLGMPMTSLVDWLLSEGLDHLETTWRPAGRSGRESPERLSRVSERKGTYRVSRRGQTKP